jgi:hypothetical protein
VSEDPDDSILLHSEFATVRVSLDVTANGPRLKIVDQRSGEVGYLDPLELESLAWARHGHLVALLDPGADRWAGPGELALDEH